MASCLKTISIATVFLLSLMVTTTQMTCATSFQAKKSFTAKGSFSIDSSIEKEINNELVVDSCKKVSYKKTCYKTYKSSATTANATDMNKVVYISIGCLLDHAKIVRKTQKVYILFSSTKAFAYKKAYNAIIWKLEAIKKAKEFKRKKMMKILNFVIKTIRFCQSISVSIKVEKKVMIKEERVFVSKNEEMMEMATNTAQMCESLPE